MDEVALIKSKEVKTPSAPPSSVVRRTTDERWLDDTSTPLSTGLPIIAIDLPVLYEDEGQEEMGEHTVHTLTDDIIRLGLESHLAGWPDHHVFSNLNLHYHRVDEKAYVSPDEMVVVADLPPSLVRSPVEGPVLSSVEGMGSYRVGETGPAPVLAVEVLSKRTYQQQDISPTGKPIIYAELGVAEYILVDVTGEFLPERLLLKRLNPDVLDEEGQPTWQDEQDTDGGVTSQLGFRLVIEDDGHVRVLDAASGRHYLRPLEVEAARQQAEQRATAAEQRAAEAEQRAAEEAAARQQAEQRATEEVAARQAMADELARLQAELTRLRSSRPNEFGT